VREKEKGTIEQINVSSVSSFELITGKSLPYIIISLINAAFILIAGYLLFDVVVKGSYILLFLTTLVFIVASVSLGIFISVVSDSQQVAFSISTFVSLLPSVILSGFVFPIESMPFLVQIITNITILFSNSTFHYIKGSGTFGILGSVNLSIAIYCSLYITRINNK